MRLLNRGLLEIQSSKFMIKGALLIQDMLAFQRSIKRLRKDMYDFRVAWKKIHPILIPELKKQHKSEGQLVGQTWAPLNKQYAAWKMRQVGNSSANLILTGKLKDRFTPLSITHTRMRIGTTGLKYAAAVHWGGKIKQKIGPPTEMPRRAFMLWRPATEEMVINILATYTDTNIKLAFRKFIKSSIK